MKKFLLTCFAILPAFYSFSQDFSNKGKDFWIAYEGHIDGTNSRMALYITSDVDASGTLEVNGVFKAFTVTANQVTTVQLTNATSPSNTSAYNAQIEGIGVKKGVHIITTKPVAVYSHILNAARSGSTLVIPTNVLGKEYYVATYKSSSTGNPRRCQFDIVATEDNSTIEITPTNADASNIHPANVTFQVTLSKGDVYQYQSNEDLTGSHIKSIGSGTGGCKKIAVFSGSTWTAMGCAGASSGDNLYQEMFPYSSWGKTYYSAPFISRSFDIFRVIVQDPTVPVFVNGVQLSLATIINNRFYEFNTQGNNTARIINSASPICVLQYMITQNCDNVNADPEMIILNAVEQTLNDITVMSARNDLTPPNTNIASHYLNIIYKSNTYGSLRVDGNPPLGFPQAIGATGYSFIQENVTASTAINPAHRITSDSGFICIAYGYGNVESYGYNAGTNVKDLFNFITPINPLNITGEPSACANTPFYFSVTYPFQPLSLDWDFYGFQTPNVTITNPVADTTYFVNGKQVWRYRLPTLYVYPASGNYPVSITAGTSGSDGCGNSQTRDDTLYIFDPPLTTIGIIHNGCVTDSVSFRDSTNYVQGTYSYKWWWDFGDGSNDSVRNPKHIYAAPGTYTVRFALISNVGCLSDTGTRQIIVTLVPQAKFGLSNPVCSGLPITLSDSSVVFQHGFITRWYWDYGDGTKDTVNNNSDRIYTFSPYGNKTVTLKVETNSGCVSNLYSKIFYLNPIPVADFIMPPGICLPSDSAHFFDASTIADGTQSGFSYVWDFGDIPSGVNNNSTVKDPVHFYNNAGPFNIKLTVTSAAGCVKDTTKTLSTVYPQSAANFSVNPENCLDDTTYFTDLSTPLAGFFITNWLWKFGDGQISTLQNPSYRYALAGTYSVTLYYTTDKGCNSDTVTKQVVINPLPTSSFTFSAPTCETRAVTFTSTAVPNVGNLILWKWDMGDGTLLNRNTGAGFTHVYASAQTYTVTLAVETDKGCKSSIYTVPVVVHAQPTPDFILPGVCLSDAFALFADSSYIADGTDSSFTYLWNFGDPTSGPLNISILKNPMHKYLAAAVYTVTLTVTSNNGCTASITKLLTVNGVVPKADFLILNPTALCSNTDVQIRDSSKVLDFGGLTKVEIYWDYVNSPGVFDVFINPAPNTVYGNLYPNFQLPLTKNFNIRLRAFSGGTCVDEKTRTVTVNATPKVQFNNIPDTCLYITPFQITQASEIGGVPGTGAFTGQGISTAGIFDPAVAGVGPHLIRYTFTSNKGCIDFQEKTINILPPPVAKYGFSPIRCETQAVIFFDSSISTAGSLTTWIWDFGDGTPLVVRNNASSFTHVFNTTNTYQVKLTVRNNNGCNSSQYTFPVIIHPRPVPDFTMPKVCLPNANATFINQSAITDGTASLFTYLWDFGDPGSGTNNISVAKDPGHLYNTVGPYSVRLTVTSSNGCVKDTLKVYNDIHPQPSAQFTSNVPGVCTGASISFIDQSDPKDGTTTEWHWNFGDGATDLTSNPSHTFTVSGTPSVQLYIINSQGCRSNTFTSTVTIYAYPVVNAGPDKNVLEGGTVTLDPVVTGNGLSYLWTPPDYLTGANTKNPVVTGVEDRIYTLSVTATGGCIATDQVKVIVLKFPTIPNTFTPNNDGINDLWVIQNLETYPDCRVQVFNRYGQLMFESKGYTTPWNGTMKGKSLPFGTYYYIIEPGSGRKPLTGYVTLIK